MRDECIRGWGIESVKTSAIIFDISERRVRQILGVDPDSKRQQILKPKSRIQEDVHLWIKILDANLVKKSGEKADTSLRSPYSKSELYEMFQTAWYGMALDQQLEADPP
jgi:hypothetical protein